MCRLMCFEEGVSHDIAKFRSDDQNQRLNFTAMKTGFGRLSLKDN